MMNDLLTARRRCRRIEDPFLCGGEAVSTLEGGSSLSANARRKTIRPIIFAPTPRIYVQMPRSLAPEDNWAALIGDLYDAAVTPNDATRIPALLAEVANGVTSAVCSFGKDHFQQIMHDVPLEAQIAYQENYRLLDPWTKRILTKYPDGYLPVTNGRRLIDDDVYLKSEYYNDFARPFDMSEVIGGAVPLGNGRVAIYSTHRLLRNRQFDDDDEARVGRFIPHLQRALQLRERLGLRVNEVGFAALDRLAFGAVVCDGSGRVLFANGAAEAASRDGEGLVFGRSGDAVGAVVPIEGQHLLRLIRDASAGGTGGSIALGGRAGGVLMVLVTPLPRRLDQGPALALLALRSSAAQTTLDAATLAALFGLTRAEAALTAALADGRTLTEIGAERGTAPNTLRTQLAHIFRKTGTRSQADLIRVVGLVPPLR